jgi:hypothetical protein
MQRQPMSLVRRGLSPFTIVHVRVLRWTVAITVAGALGVMAGGRPEPTNQSAAQPFVGVLDEHPSIQYASRPTRDRVSDLAHRVAGARAALAFDEPSGYLRSVLSALDLTAESQLLVFSRTGIQRASTSPHNPRAIYFDESVVVGFIPGARFLELAAHDPEQGVVFYTIDQTAATTPAIIRRTDCLTCHVSSSTLEVPGMIHRSNMLSADGQVLPMLGSHTVDHRTPITQRWGGWFVTGRYSRPPYDGTAHMGNVTVAMHPTSGPATTSNEVFVEWLNSKPETRGYPSSESDVAALMVFDHQMHAINLITRLHWETRVAAASGRLDFAQGVLQQFVNELTDYLLFVDEVKPPGKVTPRRGFAAWFTVIGPRDGRGRSLRELDLDGRLLRYPCSYMIHSVAFEALPINARRAIYDRMLMILSAPEKSPRYAHLSIDDRRAIVEILRDTKHDLPDKWRQPFVPGAVFQ